VFTGEDDFIKALKDTSPDARALIDALFNDPDFLKLWNYLKSCPAINVALSVDNTIKDSHGDELFGLTPPGKLIVNTHKREHHDNPSELLDTLIHEVIHALWDAKQACADLPWPLPDDVYDWPDDPGAVNRLDEPEKDDPDSPDKRHAQTQYGDSPSSTKRYIDVNFPGQRLICGLIEAALKATAGGAPRYRLKGRPTLTHENLRRHRKLAARHWSKNWKDIRSITWEPDGCWHRTSTPRGWIMECTCDSAQMIVKYDDGTVQIDLLGKGDNATFDGGSVTFDRLFGWDQA
jgi:hypothetical protein